MDEPYNDYVSKVKQLEQRRDDILSKTTNVNSDFGYDLSYGFAMAALDNVTYWLQDETQIKNILESSNNGEYHSKLLSVFGIEGYNDEVEYNINIRYGSISDKMNDFTPEQRSDYLTLMYGEYYEDTYNTLTRTTLDDGTTAVPEEKLVFIGSRVNGFPHLATDATYGIGGASSASEIPDAYSDLADKYKTPFLFGSENDYNIFIENINNDENFTTSLEQNVKDAVRVSCFNYYLDYIFTLKFTYSIYGENYDLIMKGHPSEVLGAYQSWTSHYTADGYTYDLLINNLIYDFHESDSIGKYIGMVPYGTAAENLAYLGADVSIGGLPSSTYTGYDPDVDVKFVIHVTNGDITVDNNLKSRYENGTLKDHTIDGTECITTFYNIGNIYKYLSEYYEENHYSLFAEQYSEAYTNWLMAQTGLDDITGYYVDAQGFIKFE